MQLHGVGAAAGRPLRLRLPNSSPDRANFVAVQLTLRLPDEATLVFTGSLGAPAGRSSCSGPAGLRLCMREQGLACSHTVAAFSKAGSRGKKRIGDL